MKKWWGIRHVRYWWLSTFVFDMEPLQPHERFLVAVYLLGVWQGQH